MKNPLGFCRIASRWANLSRGNIQKNIAFMVLSSALAAGAKAETLTLTPQSSNAQVMQAGGNYSSSSVRVGLTSSSSYGCATEYVFAMPKLAFGDTITSANFSVNVAAIKGSGFTFNADLYSLGTATSSVIAPNGNYFQGDYATDPNAAPLQQHFLSSSPLTPVGRVYASSTGNSALAADLQARVAAGATGGSYYFLRLNPDFPVAWNAVLGWNVSLQQDVAANQPTLSVTTSPPAQKGRVLIEYWSGLTGSTLASLTSSPNYPNKPSARECATSMEIPQSLDINSGTRLRGLFYPPTTGNYTFAVASDDYSVLLLSTDSDPAHAVTIASVAGWTTYQQWNKYSSQTSAPIPLVAGQAYYIEAQHKQGTGGANLSIGYMPPGTGSIVLMPTTDVAPYDAGANYSTGAAASILTQAHPRLLVSPAALKRISSAITVAGSTPNTWWTAIQAQANTILGQAVIVPAANTSFIAPARTLQDRIYYLGLDYLLNTDSTVRTNCLTKIYAELQSAANWGGTNNNTAPGNWNAYQFLDVPEVAHAYAIAYDWCYNGWTSTQRTFLLNTIANQALQPGITSYGPPTANYFNGVTNWTTICDTGLALSALAILGDETTSPKAPTILDDLLPALNSSPAMASWSPDGGWSEAPTYWAFSMRYLSTFFAALETSEGTCFNFDKLGGMAAAGSFPLYVTGPLFKSFNFSDEDGDNSGQDMIPGEMFLGLKYNQPVYSWIRRQFGSGYPTDLIWYDPRGSASGSTPWSLNLPTSALFRNCGVIILRSAWNDTNALFGGLKAGYNPNASPYGSGHEQLEIGSFVFDALNIRWASDLARDYYNTPYFNVTPSLTTPNRWQFYRCRAEGNNTLVFNPGRDGGQALDATTTVTNFQSTTSPNVQQGIVDMTSAYAKDIWGAPTVVTGAKRGMRFVQATNTTQMVAQLQDEVTTSSAYTVDLNWFMHTATTISISGNTATLSSGTSRLLLTIKSPSTAVFKSMAAVPFSGSPDQPGFPNGTLPSGNIGGEKPTTGFNKLWIEYTIPAGTQSTTVKVDLCPYTAGGTVPTAPAAPALSSW